jgi:hypothetical protein
MSVQAQKAPGIKWPPVMHTTNIPVFIEGLEGALTKKAKLEGSIDTTVFGGKFLIFCTKAPKKVSSR